MLRPKKFILGLLGLGLALPATAAMLLVAVPDEANAKPKNPIAAAHPGMDVVVCEAGCSNASEKQEAVYVQVTTEHSVQSIAEVKPTSSANAPDDSALGVIRCLGGCYDTPKVYHSTFTTPEIAATPTGGRIVPLNAKPSDTGSGAWMRRIDRSRSAPTGN